MHTRRKRTKLIAVICSIVCLWGAGISLVAVLCNLVIGFSDSDADFNESFLNVTFDREYGDIQSYIYLSESLKSRDSNDLKESNIKRVIENLEAKYDAERTNLRFAVTDTDGQLLLTNDPQYGKDQALLASHFRQDSVTMSENGYQVNTHFALSEMTFSELLNKNMATLLDNPADFSNWFFTYDNVDEAYHNGLTAVTMNGEYVDYLKFPTLRDAQNYDYQQFYSEYCDWKVVNATDEAAVAAANAHAPLSNDGDPFGSFGSYGDDGVQRESADTAETGTNPVLVRVTAYADAYFAEMSLDEYYSLKEQGVNVRAADELLEQHLAAGYDITVNAGHAEQKTVLIRTYLPADLPVRDTIRANYSVYRVLFQYSEHFVIAMFICLVLTVISCISMCTAAGYPDDTDRLAPSRVHAIAYEFFWLLPVLAVLVSAGVFILLEETAASYRMMAIFGIGLSLCISACCILWLYTTAVRVKSGTFWSSFFLARTARGFFGLFRSQAVVSIALTVWMAVLLGINLFAFSEDSVMILPAAGLDLLTLIGLLYAVYAYFELHRRVDRMKTGDFAPAQHALPLGADFGKFDRSLGAITENVGEIVAQQTKAEHLRTELITNVSHDLKTPLTSIVNYVDLLSREEMPNPEAKEYLDVLKRQAARLKKLTIDLVDASKASSGSMTVELMPTELQVLISQLSGEYEDRLAERQLSMVCSMPEEPVSILADGRQIWRVFDNLLGNACKYAMPGTRVYLDLTADASMVTVSLKNISASPLNVSPDELMERFVRGDSSRHTEGSGLGLSIARDLTALQHGTMTLATDGDLFKAVLQFPRFYTGTDV